MASAKAYGSSRCSNCIRGNGFLHGIFPCLMYANGSPPNIIGAKCSCYFPKAHPEFQMWMVGVDPSSVPRSSSFGLVGLSEDGLVSTILALYCRGRLRIRIWRRSSTRREATIDENRIYASSFGPSSLRV